MAPRILPKPTPQTVATFAIAVLAGFGMVASAVSARGTDLRSGRSATLRELVVRQASQVEDIEHSTASLRITVQNLAAETGGIDLTNALADVAANAPLAGLSIVQGPGVVVTLNDADRSSPERTKDVDPDLLVIHQQDVQSVMNALWRGGASALKVMDQRIIATSSVQCVGSTLLVGGRVYSPPFTIAAVGTPEKLLRALDTEPGVQLVQDLARAYGLGYSAVTTARVVAPAYTGAISVANAELL